MLGHRPHSWLKTAVLDPSGELQPGTLPTYPQIHATGENRGSQA